MSSGADSSAGSTVQHTSFAPAAGGPDLLVIEDFFDAGLCESLIRASRSADFRRAGFHEPLRDEAEALLDTTTRNVKEMRVSEDARGLVAERLLAHKPILEEHFGVELGECQRPNFLYYTAGGLYVPHTDSADGAEFPDYVRNRRVSVVIFLNSQADADAEGDYRGGSLTIYTPDYRPRSKEPGRRVRGKAGTLVAFRSNVFHEVEPVTEGERFTITAWFASRPSAPALAVNPHLSISTAGGGALTVFAPVKGEGLRITDVAEAGEPEIFELLKRLPKGGATEGLKLTNGQERRLSELGVLLPESRLSSPVRFACSIQGPPRELIPRRSHSSLEGGADAERLVVNPTFRYLDGRRWEQEVAAAISGADRFLRRGSWVLVQDAGFGAPRLYSVAPDEEELLSGFAADAPPPALPDAEMCRRLHDAGILVEPESVERWRRSRDEELRAIQAKFKESLYAVVPGLVHPLQVAALRQYYRQLIAEGFLPFGDSQVPLRYAAQNEPLSRFLQGELTGLVSRVAGEEVKPSYAYFASYRPGAVLRQHTDREQCEFSLSLLLDYVPEPDDLAPWPLFLKERGPEGREVPVRLGLGDALIYKGRELAHRRDALPEGHSSSSFFFHYVRKDFGGRLH